mmetsp:Transcript_23477/g.26928  ORF Transcript_23477/g.26928 Transcript_23477/m.26928 type:complete len:89 (+) Transcript_23477:3-269(+)
MSYYGIIRQCCGLQQSKYNRYRLHGCNVTQLLMDEPDIPYPYCEQHDLPKLEKEFDALPLKLSKSMPWCMGGESLVIVPNLMKGLLLV